MGDENVKREILNVICALGNLNLSEEEKEKIYQNAVKKEKQNDSTK